jgi:hypothetical protein
LDWGVLKMLNNKNSFFIGFGQGGNIKIDGSQVIVDLPLDLYVDESNNVYAGRKDNNAILIYVNDNEIYTRKVV